MLRNLPPYIWTEDPAVTFEDFGCKHGEWDGVPAWTNGRVMFKGAPPIFSVEMAKQSFQQAITRVANATEEIFPVAVAHPEWLSVAGVFFSDGRTILAARYFYYVLNKYPDARFFADAQNEATWGVLVKASGASVGLVMSMNSFGNEWPGGVKEFLC